MTDEQSPTPSPLPPPMNSERRADATLGADWGCLGMMVMAFVFLFLTPLFMVGWGWVLGGGIMTGVIAWFLELLSPGRLRQKYGAWKLRLVYWILLLIGVVFLTIVLKRQADANDVVDPKNPELRRI